MLRFDRCLDLLTCDEIGFLDRFLAGLAEVCGHLFNSVAHTEYKWCDGKTGEARA